jgi:transposase
MTTETATTQANESRQDAWARWQCEHAVLLERATGPQRVLLEATVRFVAVIAAQPILLRVAAYFLLHAGMGLTLVQVGAAVGRTDRAMHTVRALAPRELLDSIWAELGRHRQPRLHAEHAGPIAKYLVDHPRCTQSEVVAFIARELSVEIEVQTLRRFLESYGLYVLCPDHDHRSPEEADGSRPSSSGAPTSGAPSSSCRPRSP